MKEQALRFVAKRVDVDELHHVMYKSGLWRSPIYVAFPIFTMSIRDLLDEFADDNSLPEDWEKQYWDDIDECIHELLDYVTS